MAGITLRNLHKRFPNGFTAVVDLSLDIEDREFLVLVGPSGCGKTTTLRMIAGLETATSGDILIGGKNVRDVAPKDRDIAMVFQNYALYPHMSVYQNMAVGLSLRHIKKDEIKRRVTDTARMLGIDSLLDRKPKQLSGGERQRVAMGRAIVREPKAFLMDEPLSNLDAKLRVQMRTEISKLYQRMRTTFVYVTHDQIEAMTLGTRIVVMNKGEIQQADTPERLYNFPNNTFVAGFIGSPQMNFFDAAVDNGEIILCGSRFPLTAEQRAAVGERKHIILGLRPNDISEHPLDGLTITASVELVERLGSETYLHLSIDGTACVASAPSSTAAVIGQDIEVSFNLGNAHLFDKEDEQRI